VAATLKNMGKKPSKRGKQTLVATQPGEGLSHCPFCGTINLEKSALSLTDQLFRSHAELCTALRLAGRLLLAFEKQDHQSLQKIREVLKRADNIRKSLGIADEMPEAPRNTYEFVADPPTPEYDDDQAMQDGPIRKRTQRRTRLTRPYPLRILKFPTG